MTERSDDSTSDADESKWSYEQGYNDGLKDGIEQGELTGYSEGRHDERWDNRPPRLTIGRLSEALERLAEHRLEDAAQIIANGCGVDWTAMKARYKWDETDAIIEALRFRRLTPEQIVKATKIVAGLDIEAALRSMAQGGIDDAGEKLAGLIDMDWYAIKALRG